MRAGATPLCEATCAMRGRHVPDCPDPDTCRGCQPRQAADGLRVCDVHAERIAEDARQAPVLYADLGLVLIRRATRGGEPTSGSSAGAPAPDDDVMEARGQIRAVLLRLTGLITVERGLSAPLTRRGDMVYLDTRPQALGPYVARHADWLAAHVDAGRHADALHAVTRGTPRRLAYPSGTDRLYIGDCPLLVRDRDGTETVCATRLYQHPDRPLITCAGCGTDETVEQWQLWMVGDADAVSDAYAVAAHLALQWMRPVDPALIRQWAHRGHIQAVTRADPTPTEPDRQTVVRDAKGRTLYVISEVVGYAERIWGPPYRPRRR